MQTIDLETQTVRSLNQALHDHIGSSDKTTWEVLNPRGAHAIAVGIDSPMDVTIKGNAGYFCGSMNKHADIHIKGSAGPGLGENMMSGTILVDGDASQNAGATAHGGLMNIKGNASARLGISMKGVDIVVHGSIGHMAAFMGQSGNLVVLGDAGEALGDSCYEARFFVRGEVKSLGADCEKKEMRPEHIEFLKDILERTGADAKPEEFTRYGSARQLYNFDVDNPSAY